MALMMDNKPTEYKGEALVWEKLFSLLPNDVCSLQSSRGG